MENEIKVAKENETSLSQIPLFISFWFLVNPQCLSSKAKKDASQVFFVLHRGLQIHLSSYLNKAKKGSRLPRFWVIFLSPWLVQCSWTAVWIWQRSGECTTAWCNLTSVWHHCSKFDNVPYWTPTAISTSMVTRALKYLSLVKFLAKTVPLFSVFLKTLYLIGYWFEDRTSDLLPKTGGTGGEGGGGRICGLAPVWMLNSNMTAIC